jgi:hypothetical protein
MLLSVRRVDVLEAWAFRAINYELPDGYTTNGWTVDDESIVEKWEPYYYRQKLCELKDGDIFNGVKVKMVKAECK